MPNKVFYIVDVFAEEPFGGNQLAVFLDGSQYRDDTMQKIAREMNFSETTFIMSNREINGSWPVRIFTPREEIPFAGHPTIGTAYVIQTFLIKKPVKRIVLKEKAGDIPVDLSYVNDHPDILTMTQLPPTFGNRADIDVIAEIIRLNPEDIDKRFPLEVVSTGFPALIIPLKTLDALKRASLHRDKYYSYVKHFDTGNFCLFAPETRSRENQLSVRMFAESLGVPEDPATGSANGCLAGYLVRHNYFDKDGIDIKVEQGHEICRPSRLHLYAKKREKDILVKVGGKANLFSKGEILMPNL